MGDSAYSIIDELRREIYGEYRSQDISIFLCGGASKDQALFRYRLGKTITTLQSKYMYSVYYPETLFTEVMSGYKRVDLLKLENQLAESVNSVVIPLQSPGTFTELGAFTNHKELFSKLIVIMDQEYKTKKSFINDGPIAYLKKNRRESIIYGDFSCTRNNIKELAYKVTEVARSISTNYALPEKLDNPITSQLFYLCVIFLFDPISITDFERIVSKLSNKPIGYYGTDTILSYLITQCNIRVLNNKLLTFKESSFTNILSRKGYKDNQIWKLVSFLSKLRIQALNLYYRRNGVIFGEGESSIYRQLEITNLLLKT